MFGTCLSEPVLIANHGLLALEAFYRLMQRSSRRSRFPGNDHKTVCHIALVIDFALHWKGLEHSLGGRLVKEATSVQVFKVLLAMVRAVISSDKATGRCT